MYDLPEIILTVPVFLLAISLHEFAHALVAVRLGDPTPKLQGRLTLNFLTHFSWLGAIMLLVAGIGWAKPVQVSARNFRNPVKAMLWVSLAGPVANLLQAIAFAGLLRLAAPYLVGTVGNSIGTLLYLGIRLNLLFIQFI
jgi:Zn-dependent protease